MKQGVRSADQVIHIIHKSNIFNACFTEKKKLFNNQFVQNWLFKVTIANFFHFFESAFSLHIIAPFYNFLVSVCGTLIFFPLICLQIGSLIKYYRG